jgi:hypothetical protein
MMDVKLKISFTGEFFLGYLGFSGGCASSGDQAARPSLGHPWIGGYIRKAIAAILTINDDIFKLHIMKTTCNIIVLYNSLHFLMNLPFQEIEQ